MTSRPESGDNKQAHKISSDLMHHNFKSASSELAHELHNNPKEYSNLLKSINNDLTQHHERGLNVERDKNGNITHINFGKHDLFGHGNSHENKNSKPHDAHKPNHEHGHEHGHKHGHDHGHKHGHGHGHEHGHGHHKHGHKHGHHGHGHGHGHEQGPGKKPEGDAQQRPDVQPEKPDSKGGDNPNLAKPENPAVKPQGADKPGVAKPEGNEKPNVANPSTDKSNPKDAPKETPNRPELDAQKQKERLDGASQELAKGLGKQQSLEDLNKSIDKFKDSIKGMQPDEIQKSLTKALESEKLGGRFTASFSNNEVSLSENVKGKSVDIANVKVNGTGNPDQEKVLDQNRQQIADETGKFANLLKGPLSENDLNKAFNDLTQKFQGMGLNTMSMGRALNKAFEDNNMSVRASFAFGGDNQFVKLQETPTKSLKVFDLNVK